VGSKKRGGEKKLREFELDNLKDVKKSRQLEAA